MSTRSRCSYWFSFLALLGGTVAVADVKLPAIFSDFMVLQRNQENPVWGQAAPGDQVTVTVADQHFHAQAAKDGRWRVMLKPLTAGGPHVLTVQGKNTIRLKDILVGEVWLCSGQSNMAMSVSRSLNPETEAKAATYPNIRMFSAGRKAMEKQADNVQGSWVVCSPKTVGAFSATAYFFGRKLHQELDVPVGLINSSWGGTPIEAWTSRPQQEPTTQIAPLLAYWQSQLADYDAEKTKANYEKSMARWQVAAKKARDEGNKPPRRPRAPVDPKTSQHRPANLYNGMIAPLATYGIRGAIWYQGEHNASRSFSDLYGVQLPLMIRDWRTAWGQGEFPFLFVQLPNFQKPQTQPVEQNGWIAVREGMLKSLNTANTGMAVTVDVGEANDIHPKNKQAVGSRLALWALGTTYRKTIIYSGPLFQSARLDGDRIVVSFEHDSGLAASDGSSVRGFVIAGKDQKFVFAEATIVGDEVVVTSPKVKNPVAVRYAWASNPDCNLVNKSGLPASPFRTDAWK